MTLPTWIAQIISVEATDSQFSKVLVQFTDDHRGCTRQPSTTVVKRFLFELRVDQSGALIIGIYAAPASKQTQGYLP